MSSVTILYVSLVVVSFPLPRVGPPRTKEYVACYDKGLSGAARLRHKVVENCTLGLAPLPPTG